mgnify:CR=1 FL=1
MNFIKSGNGVVVIFKDTIRPVRADSPVFEKLMDALRKNAEDLVRDLIDKAQAIRKHSSGLFHADENGTVYLGSEAVPATLANHLVKFMEAGVPVQPLIAFWDRLKKNPSPSARKDLYDFLVVNSVPLTEDGKFLGYRRVSDDYLDLYTGKIDNSVGSYVSMDRKLVDADRNNTCSTGLHVAAYNYAANVYGNGRGKLVEVLVDPEDVVAVPPDYDQQKMRVCAYEVVRDCSGEHKTLIVEEEQGKNRRTYYLRNFKNPCKSMTIEDITSHKPTKAGHYSSVRASTTEEAYQEFLKRVK